VSLSIEGFVRISASSLAYTGYETREAAIKCVEKELPYLAILDIILQDEVGGGYEVSRFSMYKNPLRT